MYSTGLIMHEGKAYSPNGQTDLGKSELLDCGHARPAVQPNAFTAPWGIVQTSDGPAEYCVECCERLELEAVRVLPKGAGYTGYYGLKNPPRLGGRYCYANTGNEITTWHGTRLMTIVEYNIYYHNFGGRFISIKAFDVWGNYWHGRASYDWGNCINMYKNKVQPNEEGG